ncbi:VOC family protein [Streptomyces fradiae]|uniref:VOC family protein n=1 Tax=Streptomyces fradiae TaxID=1906 RepID=UPI0036493C2D
MITTDFAPGSPCWLDLGAPDVRAAAAFYGAVLGWEYEPMGEGEEADGGVLRKDGRIVAGLGRLTEEGARSAWMIYYSVTDADAATRAVEQAGGSVRVAPTDLDGWGRMAQFSDPLGGQFAVWQPGTTRGVELVDQPGSLAWTELYTSDAAGAREFYGTVFGWRFGDMAMPGDGGTYFLITPAGLPDERMHGGLLQVGPKELALAGGRPYWHPVFAVADCDAAATAVTGHGGSVPMGPVDAEGVGRMAFCLDPAGADFLLLTPAGD